MIPDKSRCWKQFLATLLVHHKSRNRAKLEPWSHPLQPPLERVQIPFGSGNFGLLILKWWPVLHHSPLATVHLQEDRGLEGLL